MPNSLRLVLLIVVMAGVGRSASADPDRGGMLYKNHCSECHTSVVHVRDRHKAESRDELLSWIQRWQTHLGLSWTAQEMKDVLDYLDLTYYKFLKE